MNNMYNSHKYGKELVSLEDFLIYYLSSGEKIFANHFSKFKV